jgi:hypothetical protein
MTTTAELKDRSEVAKIDAWRREQLEVAGYPADAAAALASRHDVDLHRAIDLLADGCPPDVALRILL